MLPTMSLPAPYGFNLTRGDYFIKKFRFKIKSSGEYVDFDGQTGRAHMRDEDDELVGSFTVATGTDATGHFFSIEAESNVTELLPVERLFYDVEMTNAGKPTTWVNGFINVKKDKTHD